MIEIGKVNKLTICSENHSGFYLKSDDSDEEIFMPPSLAPDGVKVGQILKVFVYMDTTNSLIATAKTPYAQVGEYAVMKAIHVKDFGAFFVWGISRRSIVFKEVPASDPLLNDGEMAAMVVLKSSNETPAWAATSGPIRAPCSAIHSATGTENPRLRSNGSAIGKASANHPCRIGKLPLKTR